jgi:hypothetical protein
MFRLWGSKIPTTLPRRERGRCCVTTGRLDTVLLIQDSHGSAPGRVKLSCLPMTAPPSRSHRKVVPSIPLYNACRPSGETDKETRPRAWAGIACMTWPEVEFHRLGIPSAEMDTTALSFAVQEMSHTASPCASVEGEGLQVRKEGSRECSKTPYVLHS